MKAVLLTVGKTDINSIATEIDKYTKRIGHYLPFSMEVIPDIKNKRNLSQNEQKQKEGDLILSKLHNTDYVVLLDEGGRLFNSNQFAQHIENIFGKHGFGNKYNGHQHTFYGAGFFKEFEGMDVPKNVVYVFLVNQYFRKPGFCKKFRQFQWRSVDIYGHNIRPGQHRLTGLDF